MGDLDKFCTVIVVVGALVLLFMGYNEVVNMNAYQRSSTTCGMQAKASVPTQAASAKRSGTGTAPTGERLLASGDYLSMQDAWPNNEGGDESKHKEMPQDEDALRTEFTWEATPEDNKKFDSLKIDPEKVKRLANTKAVNPNIQGEKPTYSRKLGLMNPLVDMYHGCGKNDSVKFGQACSWFGGTDAYYAAREATSRCDCLHENCDAPAEPAAQ